MTIKHKGFSLVEVICGIALIGIIAVSFFPLLNTSIKNISRLKDHSRISYIAETVVENLKTSSEKSVSTLNSLDIDGSINYIDEDIDSNKFKCTITKLSSTDKLIEFIVKVELKSLGDDFNVEYKASVLKK